MDANKWNALKKQPERMKKMLSSLRMYPASYMKVSWNNLTIDERRNISNWAVKKGAGWFETAVDTHTPTGIRKVAPQHHKVAIKKQLQGVSRQPMVRQASVRTETKEREALPDIVKRAMREPITNIGQLSKDETRDLNKFVKKGILIKGKGGEFWIQKTVYAIKGHDIAADRRKAVEEIIKIAKAEGRYTDLKETPPVHKVTGIEIDADAFTTAGTIIKNLNQEQINILTAHVKKTLPETTWKKIGIMREVDEETGLEPHPEKHDVAFNKLKPNEIKKILEAFKTPAIKTTYKKEQARTPQPITAKYTAFGQSEKIPIEKVEDLKKLTESIKKTLMESSYSPQGASKQLIQDKQTDASMILNPMNSSDVLKWKGNYIEPQKGDLIDLKGVDTTDSNLIIKNITIYRMGKRPVDRIGVTTQTREEAVKEKETEAKRKIHNEKVDKEYKRLLEKYQDRARLYGGSPTLSLIKLMRTVVEEETKHRKQSENEMVGLDSEERKQQEPLANELWINAIATGKLEAEADRREEEEWKHINKFTKWKREHRHGKGKTNK